VAITNNKRTVSGDLEAFKDQAIWMARFFNGDVYWMNAHRELTKQMLGKFGVSDPNTAAAAPGEGQIAKTSQNPAPESQASTFSVAPNYPSLAPTPPTNTSSPMPAPVSQAASNSPNPNFVNPGISNSPDPNFVNPGTSNSPDPNFVNPGTSSFSSPVPTPLVASNHPSPIPASHAIPNHSSTSPVSGASPASQQQDEALMKIVNFLILRSSDRELMARTCKSSNLFSQASRH
jgi:hypothetical protein